MTLDEAIKRFSDNAEYERSHGSLQGCLEFRQLAEWLAELKKLKEQTEPCEDCISRQAAIDALDKGAWGVEWDKALAKAMLENLPSAQPDLQQSCNHLVTDCISRQAAIDAIHYYCKNICGLSDYNWCPDCPSGRFVGLLKELPSVTAERKGKWIPMHHSFEGVSETYFVYQYMCSECKALSYFRRDSEQKIVNATICPNCGAKMEESEDKEK